MEKPFDCIAFAEAIRNALVKALPGVEIADEPGSDASAVTFVHPAHEATVVLLVEATDDVTPVPTLLLSIVVGDWQAAVTASAVATIPQPTAKTASPKSSEESHGRSMCSPQTAGEGTGSE